MALARSRSLLFLAAPGSVTAAVLKRAASDNALRYDLRCSYLGEVVNDAVRESVVLHVVNLVYKSALLVDDILRDRDELGDVAKHKCCSTIVSGHTCRGGKMAGSNCNSA